MTVAIGFDLGLDALRVAALIDDRIELVVTLPAVVGDDRDRMCVGADAQRCHPDDRVDVMMRMLPYLPLFVALSTSSPFWNSRPTGLKDYRLAAYDELPQTGVPELFRNKDDFEAYVGALVKAGVMKDASYVWWSIRRR